MSIVRKVYRFCKYQEMLDFSVPEWVYTGVLAYIGFAMAYIVGTFIFGLVLFLLMVVFKVYVPW